LPIVGGEKASMKNIIYENSDTSYITHIKYVHLRILFLNLYWTSGIGEVVVHCSATESNTISFAHLYADLFTKEKEILIVIIILI
jgi:hypothetical protein